jgi:hypothetical protein
VEIISLDDTASLLSYLHNRSKQVLNVPSLLPYYMAQDDFVISTRFSLKIKLWEVGNGHTGHNMVLIPKNAKFLNIAPVVLALSIILQALSRMTLPLGLLTKIHIVWM